MKDFGHVPVFGLITFALFVLSINFGRDAWPREVHYGVAGLIALILGGITELMQSFTTRQPDIFDYLRDVIGVICALSVLATWDKQLIHLRRLTQSPLKHVVRIVAMGMILVVLSPVVIWSQAYWHRSTSFPWICRFDAGWELLFVGTDKSELTVVPSPRDWKKAQDDHVGRIEFYPDRYPRIEIEEPYPDWRGFSHLTFEIYSELNEVITLFVRIHDSTHNGKYGDRFNSKIPVSSGLTRVRISLDEIRKGPLQREIDLSLIRSIQIFAVDPPRPLTLYLDDFRLQSENSEVTTGGMVKGS